MAPSNGIFVINAESPMGFDLSQDEMRYYQCFGGKLSFVEIARRVAEEDGIDEALALRTGLDVYRKCEDHLAALLVL